MRSGCGQRPRSTERSGVSRLGTRTSQLVSGSRCDRRSGSRVGRQAGPGSSRKSVDGACSRLLLICWASRVIRSGSWPSPSWSRASERAMSQEAVALEAGLNRATTAASSVVSATLLSPTSSRSRARSTCPRRRSSCEPRRFSPPLGDLGVGPATPESDGHDRLDVINLVGLRGGE